MEKICRICGIPKEIINFPYRKDTSNYRNECIECYKEIRKKYKNNLERNREDQKRHYLNNTEKVKARVRAYKLSKKDDPTYKLIRSLRRRMYNFIKENKYNKKSTLQYIGCNPTELKEHIQQQFTKGMTWENYGYYGWHIDHKIPLSSHKTEEELYKLCHFSNLQPMWWKENLHKSNKL